jgi:F-type H+-transporting ATPase subunit a
MATENPLNHVVDHPIWHLLWWEVPLPKIAGFQITQFMAMELIAAVLVAVVIIPLARHVARNPVSRGNFMNLFEALVLFIRDGIARPAIGGHGADRFLPFLWTMFFFVLFCNLLGMIPGGASPTGNINVTAVLALSTLSAVCYAGMRELGVVGFFVGIVPHLDVPPWIKPPLWVLMFFIELAGLLIRHTVLAVRLFANMFAGHVVLAVIMGFILMAGGWLFYFVMPACVAGVVMLSLLELFVAFLQSYIFVFLSALFIGSVLHPH